MLVRLHARLRRWRRKISRSEWIARHFGAPTLSTSADAPGLLLIQIDGLSRLEMENAMNRGRLPWLKKLHRQQGYRIHDFYSGLPASTPAVQAELYYGVRCAVPTFSFLDPATGKVEMMMKSGPAKRVEARLAQQARGLLEGGSSWSNIYTGGADQAESHFCAASMGFGDMWRTGKLRNLLLFAFLHVGSFLRLVALLPVEIVLGIYDAFRGIATHRERWSRELIFVFARVLVCVGLRELITLGAKVDVARGLPIIHVNFLGYDEQSHRRGPSSAFAHWTLKGIDRAIKHLHRAARRSGRRDYDVWIFSDHGQIRARPFAGVVPGGLHALVDQQLHLSATTVAVGREPRAPSPASWLRRPAAEPTQTSPPKNARPAPNRPSFTLAAMGPVGNIYLTEPLSPARLRRLAIDLLKAGVPGILIPLEPERATWLTAHGEFELPDHYAQLPHLADLQRVVAEDLIVLAHHPRAGDLIALGWTPRGESFSFADENGSHAGCSPAEIGAFMLLPTHVRPPDPTRPTRPAELRHLARQHLGRVDQKFAPATPAFSEDACRIRVATYNAHSCLGLDGRWSPLRVARVVAELRADVVALQELDCDRPRSGHRDQLADIAQFLGYESMWCPATRTADGGSYGHAILSRYPITACRSGPLPGLGQRESRAAIQIRIEVDGRPVHILSTHLGLARRERVMQATSILSASWIGEVPENEPIIVCGDLNTTAGSPVHRQFSTRFHSVQAHCEGHVGQPTFPAMLPLRQLDHIFVSPEIGVLGVEVPHHELIRVASDHLPVVADLQLPANPPPPRGLQDASPSPQTKCRTRPSTEISARASS